MISANCKVGAKQSLFPARTAARTCCPPVVPFPWATKRNAFHVALGTDHFSLGTQLNDRTISVAVAQKPPNPGTSPGAKKSQPRCEIASRGSAPAERDFNGVSSASRCLSRSDRTTLKRPFEAGDRPGVAGWCHGSDAQPLLLSGRNNFAGESAAGELPATLVHVGTLCNVRTLPTSRRGEPGETHSSSLSAGISE